MTRLVNVDCSPSGQGELRDHAPSSVLGIAAIDVAPPHVGDEAFGIIDHEEKLMFSVRLGRVNRNFGGRKPENEPPVSNVHVGELQDVAQERTIRLRVGAVDDRVGADEHGLISSWMSLVVTCRRIRQESWAEKVLMIAVTGWGQEEDRRRAEVCGFDGHLVKPVDAEDLSRLIRTLSGRKEG